MTVKAKVDAIDRFVRTLKSGGLYDDIGSAAIMAGWTNLAGALTPLKGSAPTNNGFLDADLDAGIGLKGDGSTKNLATGRANNADPQDSKHLSVYAAKKADTDSRFYIGSAGTNYSGMQGSGPGAPSVVGKNNSATFATARSFATGLLAVNRQSSSQFTFRIGGVDYLTSATSATPPANELFVFDRLNASLASNATLSWYSVGSATDLAAMDSAVSTLMSDLRAIDEQGFDRDAQDYIRRLEEADGSLLETGVKQAINRFIVGLKKDSSGVPGRSLWDALKASCILCGARTIAGALVPLTVDYGPELVDINALPTPTITDGAGSSGAWDAASNTASNTAVGTGNSYPRFLFNLGLTAGRQYRVTGRISSNNMYRVNGINLSSTATSESFVANGSSLIASGGTFDVLATASDGYLRITGDGRALFDHTIEELSIREDSSTPTSYNFASGDYDRETGLKGNGSTKYLDANRAGDADGQDDAHFSVFCTVLPTATGMNYIGRVVLGGPQAYSQTTSGLQSFTTINDNTLASTLAAPTGNILIAASRSSSANFVHKSGNATETKLSTSQSQSGANTYHVFRRNYTPSPQHSDARLAFYSIGSAISDLSLLDTRVSNLVTEIAAAIP